MKIELSDLLCEYLGELMCKDENTFDWIEKEKLNDRINAVNCLLGLDTKRESWFTRVKKAIENTPL